MLDLARCIEHTLLRPDATEDEVRNLVEAAAGASLLAVCVAGRWVASVRRWIDEGLGDLKLVAVVGFPHGNGAPQAKAFEARRAVQDGAHEIDMVVDLGAIRERSAGRLARDVEAVVSAAGARPVKAILETGLWNEREKVLAASVAVAAGAAFVKTCTGFRNGQATVDDVKLLRDVVGPDVGIKASGGIRTAAQARALIEAGADRLGSSHGPALLSDSGD